MECPYCRAPLHESSPECPACRLELGRVRALLGPIPRMLPGLCDDARLLPNRARDRLQARIDAIQHRFPQLRLQVLCRRFPDSHPFSLYVFWCFNLSGLASEREKGGDNHQLLIALDPAGHAAIMPGYGLEPFLEPERLDALLDEVAPRWGRGEWSAGLEQLLDGVERELTDSVRRTGRLFELPVHPTGSELDRY